MTFKLTLFIITCTILSIASLADVQAANIMPVDCDTLEMTHNFTNGSNVCIYGTGFEAEEEIDLYIVEDKDAYERGEAYIDVSAEIERVTTNQNGILKLWNVAKNIVKGLYDVIADRNLDGNYDEGDVVNAAEKIAEQGNDDFSDNPSQEDDCLECYEEVPEFSSIAAFGMLLTVGFFVYRKRGMQK